MKKRLSMHMVGTNFATIAVALLFAFCQVSVFAAPAVPDLDRSDEVPLQKHFIRMRSADEEEEDANEEYEEYEEDDGEDGEEGEGRNVEMEMVARIRVVWSSDEEDLYCDDHLQAARMWGILKGTESEDSTSIKEDEGPIPSESTVFITFPTQPPGDYTPQDSASPEAFQNSNLEERVQVRSMLQRADAQNQEKDSGFWTVTDFINKSLFEMLFYTENRNSESTTVVSTTITEAPTVAGQRKKLWAMEAIDLAAMTTRNFYYADIPASFWKSG